MDKNDVGISEIAEQIEILKRLARKTRDRKLGKRYDIVRLSLQGNTKKEIAAIVDVSLTQVYIILNLYKREGIDGLVLQRPTGRKTKLTAEQEAELYSTITQKLPKDVGFSPFCNWTAPLACQYVKDRFGIEFSERGMRDVFYRLKLSYTRPTYVLAKADPQKQEEFKERLENNKKNF